MKIPSTSIQEGDAIAVDVVIEIYVFRNSSSVRWVPKKVYLLHKMPPKEILRPRRPPTYAGLLTPQSTPSSSSSFSSSSSASRASKRTFEEAAEIDDDDDDDDVDSLHDSEISPLGKKQKLAPSGEPAKKTRGSSRK